MRRMYSKFAFNYQGRKNLTSVNKQLREHHHVRLDREFQEDCKIWIMLLLNVESVSRPFLDLRRNTFSAVQLKFFMDASMTVGYRAYFPPNWMFGVWNQRWISEAKPSITCLELYALCAAIMTWSERLQNMRFEVFCNNTGVRDMVNSLGSKCPHSMRLIRLLTLDNLQHNRRVFIQYINTKQNSFADSLSRFRTGGVS